MLFRSFKRQQLEQNNSALANTIASSIPQLTGGDGDDERSLLALGLDFGEEFVDIVDHAAQIVILGLLQWLQLLLQTAERKEAEESESAISN